MKNLVIVALIVGLVAGVGAGYLAFHSGSHSNVAGLGPVSPPSNFSNIIASENVGTPLLQFLSSLGILQQQETVTSGACASATTTLFAVTNPFAATSTASLMILGATGQATSTTFSVGTTSLPATASFTLSNISPSLVNGAFVATTSQFSLVSGQTGQLGSGQISAGNSVSRIIVGPGEVIGAFGTSTATGLGAKNYTGGISCQYDIKWDN